MTARQITKLANGDADHLRSRLSVFVRLASKLRHAKVRNLGQIEAVEREIDLIRKAVDKLSASRQHS